jgi:hypothetical protein
MELKGNVWEIVSAITGLIALIAYLYLERDKLDAIAISRLKIGFFFMAIGATYWLIGQQTYDKRFPLLDVVYTFGPYHMASEFANTVITTLIFLGLGVTLGTRISRSGWSAERKLAFLFVCGAIFGSVLSLVFISQVEEWWRLPVREWQGYATIVFAAAIHTAIGTILSALVVDRAIRWTRSRGSTTAEAAPTPTP